MSKMEEVVQKLHAEEAKKRNTYIIAIHQSNKTIHPCSYRKVECLCEFWQDFIILVIMMQFSQCKLQ